VTMNPRGAASIGLWVFAVALLSIASWAQQTQPPASVPAQAPQSSAAITYQKVFKGSVPEFTEIVLRQDGSSTFDIRQLDEQAAPQPFTVSASLVAEAFRLAALLHDFDGVQLDVPRRIAYLGQKTFRYQQGSEKHEVVYNYTLNTDAAQLQQLFEGLAREQSDLQELQRTMRYDRLGVNEVLQRIEDDMGTNSLPAAEALLPVLDQLASDDRYMEIARQRARTLAERIRNPH
jgi:hypothetical protein